jgi:hypothetical protein
VPFLVMRHNVVKRVYHQRSGYWKPDGEGLERFAPREWAAALDLLGGRKEHSFVTAAKTLLNQGDHALALALLNSGLLTYPTSQRLADLRRQALDPFKFVLYSEWAGAELLPVE